MSKISDVVYRHIKMYDINKTGKWDKPDPPPPNTFDRTELYIIGKAIISELEGILADKVISPQP